MATILIVDEDVSLLSRLGTQLEQEGYDVVKVSTAKPAEKLFDERTPDLVLLEVKTDREAGWRLLPTFAKKAYVIVLSSSSREQDVVRSLEAGAVDFIPKPYRSTELLTRVRLRLNHTNHTNGKTAPAPPSPEPSPASKPATTTTTTRDTLASAPPSEPPAPAKPDTSLSTGTGRKPGDTAAKSDTSSATTTGRKPDDTAAKPDTSSDTATGRKPDTSSTTTTGRKPDTSSTTTTGRKPDTSSDTTTGRKPDMSSTTTTGRTPDDTTAKSDTSSTTGMGRTPGDIAAKPDTSSATTTGRKPDTSSTTTTGRKPGDTVAKPDTSSDTATGRKPDTSSTTTTGRKPGDTPARPGSSLFAPPTTGRKDKEKDKDDDTPPKPAPAKPDTTAKPGSSLFAPPPAPAKSDTPPAPGGASRTEQTPVPPSSAPLRKSLLEQREREQKRGTSLSDGDHQSAFMSEAEELALLRSPGKPPAQDDTDDETLPEDITLGRRLYKARQRRRLTLVQVENDLHIRMWYLQAMEEEKFSLLPRGPVALNMLRSYINYLGLDASLLQEYEKNHSTQIVEPTFGPVGFKPRVASPPGWLVWTVAVLLALSVSFTAIYVLDPQGVSVLGENLHSLVIGDEEATPTMQPDTEADPAPAASPEPAQTPQPTATPAPARTPGPTATPQPRRTPTPASATPRGSPTATTQPESTFPSPFR